MNQITRIFVEAALRDIEKNYGRFVSPEDERRWQVRRIRKKAIKYGVVRS